MILVILINVTVTIIVNDSEVQFLISAITWIRKMPFMIREYIQLWLF